MDQDLTPYLIPVDAAAIRCVDERQGTEAIAGAGIPGGSYGIIDAIKHLAGVTEEEAWQRAIAAGIPMGAHVDEHHGMLGCGYGKLVETAHEKVMAPERIAVSDRHKKVSDAGGKVLTLVGDHHPTHAVINDRAGTSISPDLASKDGLGVFVYDKWAARHFGELLGFDATQFADHMENVYKKTVTALTGMKDFVTIN